MLHTFLSNLLQYMDIFLLAEIPLIINYSEKSIGKAYFCMTMSTKKSLSPKLIRIKSLVMDIKFG